MVLQFVEIHHEGVHLWKIHLLPLLPRMFPLGEDDNAQEETQYFFVKETYSVTVDVLQNYLHCVEGLDQVVVLYHVLHKAVVCRQGCWGIQSGIRIHPDELGTCQDVVLKIVEVHFGGGHQM